MVVNSRAVWQPTACERFGVQNKPRALWGAAACQLGNASSRMITEVKQRSSVSTWMGDCSKCCLSAATNPLSWLDLISLPILIVGSVLRQS